MSNMKALGRLVAASEDLTDHAMMNLQKLLEALVYASIRVESRGYRRSGDPGDRIAEIREVLKGFPESMLPEAFREVLDRAVALYEVRPRGDLTYLEAPDIFVCRNCGQVAVGSAPESCSNCAANGGVFRRFQGMFNGDNSEPDEPATLIDLLDENVRVIDGVLSRLTEEMCAHHPFVDRWCVRDHVAHLHDAQGVMIRRVSRILEEDDPFLSTEAPYETALDDEGRPPETHAIFAKYASERAAFTSRLRGLSVTQLWRRGRHEDFGHISVMHQVKYFTKHEQVHIGTLAELAAALG